MTFGAQSKLAGIFERLTPLLRTVFDNEELVATPDLSAQRVSGWDSLGNIRLFLEIEQEFGVRFTSVEITSLQNIGELADLLVVKTERTR